MLAEDQVGIETGTITLSFTLANTGVRAGMGVPQLYVRDRLASFVRPVKELKGFGRVQLAPGTAVRATFTLPVDMLNFTGAAGQRVVESGEFDLMIGASSNDIRLQSCVSVKGDLRTLKRDWPMLRNFSTQLL